MQKNTIIIIIIIIQKDRMTDRASKRGRIPNLAPTRSSAIAEGPRDASSQLKSC